MFANGRGHVGTEVEWLWPGDTGAGAGFCVQVLTWTVDVGVDACAGNADWVLGRGARGCDGRVRGLQVSMVCVALEHRRSKMCTWSGVQGCWGTGVGACADDKDVGAVGLRLGSWRGSVGGVD